MRSIHLKSNIDYYIAIFKELRRKYLGKGYSEILIKRAAKTGYNWLLGIVNMIPDEQKRLEVKPLLLYKAVDVAERWLKEIDPEKYEKGLQKIAPPGKKVKKERIKSYAGIR